MKKYWKNLKHILRHKWFVLEECCNYNIIWQGIVHDLSKFSLIEFVTYADNFFGDKKRTDFDYAWLHHQHKNKHHWNYWVVDQKKKITLPMPDKYILEMYCDWKAMSRQFNNDIKEWFDKNKNKMILHPDTLLSLECLIETGYLVYIPEPEKPCVSSVSCSSYSSIQVTVTKSEE